MPMNQLLTIMVNEVIMISMGQSSSCPGSWEFLNSTKVMNTDNRREFESVRGRNGNGC